MTHTAASLARSSEMLRAESSHLRPSSPALARAPRPPQRPAPAPVPAAARPEPPQPVRARRADGGRSTLKRRASFVQVVNAAWSLSASWEAWESGLVAALGATARGRHGVATYHLDHASREVATLALDAHIEPAVAEAARRVLETIAGEGRGGGGRWVSLAEVAAAQGLRLGGRHAALRDLRDILALVVPMGPGDAYVVAVPVMGLCLRPAEKRRWAAVARHLAAAVGARLRLRPIGAAARGRWIGEREGEVAARIRQWVAERDASPAAAADGPFDAWSAVLDGDYAAVERVDEGGRKILVMLKIPRVDDDPRRLSASEREVVSRVALGAPNKEVACDLEVPECTVARHLHRALRKLGMRGRVELIRAAKALREASRRG
ncbi:MAG: helix-turn-helix transcriptional regulator [Nannocystaceae bacterium]